MRKGEGTKLERFAGGGNVLYSYDPENLNITFNCGTGIDWRPVASFNQKIRLEAECFAVPNDDHLDYFINIKLGIVFVYNR